LSFFRTLVAAAFVALATNASAQEAPLPRGDYVTDEAGILSPAEEQQLEARIGEIEQSLPSKPQIAIVIPRSLGGRSAVAYGNAIGERWQVGQNGFDNGVVIVLAPNERDVAIVPAGGLSGVLTDGVSGRILDERVVPHLRRGNEQWAAALMGAVEGVHEQIVREPESQEAVSTEPGSPIPGIVFVLGLIATFVASLYGVRHGVAVGGASGLLLGGTSVPMSIAAILPSVGLGLVAGLVMSIFIAALKSGELGSGDTTYYGNSGSRSSGRSRSSGSSNGGFGGWGGGGGYGGGGAGRGF
jgi:uncharacterized protein